MRTVQLHIVGNVLPGCVTRMMWFGIVSVLLSSLHLLVVVKSQELCTESSAGLSWSIRTGEQAILNEFVPVVQGDLIYFQSYNTYVYINPDGSSLASIVAVSLGSHDLVWSTVVDLTVPVQHVVGIAYGAGQLFTVAYDATPNYVVHAFDALTGEPTWQHRLVWWWPRASTCPVYHSSGYVVLAAANVGLVALNATDGDQLWTWYNASVSFTAPCPPVVFGPYVCFGVQTTEGQHHYWAVIAVDPAKATVVWTVRVPASLKGVFVVSGDYLFGTSGTLFVIDLQGRMVNFLDKTTATFLNQLIYKNTWYNIKDKTLVLPSATTFLNVSQKPDYNMFLETVNVTSGSITLSVSLGIARRAFVSAAMSPCAVFILTCDGYASHVSAYSTTDGRLLWNFRYATNGFYYTAGASAPILHDDTLIWLDSGMQSVYAIKKVSSVAAPIEIPTLAPPPPTSSVVALTTSRPWQALCLILVAFYILIMMY